MLVELFPPNVDVKRRSAKVLSAFITHRHRSSVQTRKNERKVKFNPQTQINTNFK